MMRFIWSVVLIMAAWPLASAADTGRITDDQCFRDWCSYILHINNRDIARISTQSARQTAFVINYDSDGAEMLIIIPKKGSDVGNVYLPNQQTKIYCALLIDSDRTPSFSTTCDVTDDNANFFVKTGLVFAIPMYLQQGSRLKLQIGEGRSAFYDTFSLMGFSRAFNRTEKLREHRGLCPYC